MMTSSIFKSLRALDLPKFLKGASDAIGIAILIFIFALLLGIVRINPASCKYIPVPTESNEPAIQMEDA